MSANPRTFAYIPAEPERRHGSDLIAEHRTARDLAAQRRALTPPTPEDRPKPSPVPDAHQGSFYSSGG